MSSATDNTQSLEQQIAELKAQNEALIKKMAPSDRFSLGEGLSCKIGQKGAISIYGLNVKWPITLYKGQLTRLFKVIPELEKFMQAHDAELAVKTPAPKAVPTKA